MLRPDGLQTRGMGSQPPARAHAHAHTKYNNVNGIRINNISLIFFSTLYLLHSLNFLQTEKYHHPQTRMMTPKKSLGNRAGKMAVGCLASRRWPSHQCPPAGGSLACAEGEDREGPGPRLRASGSLCSLLLFCSLVKFTSFQISGILSLSPGHSRAP